MVALEKAKRFALVIIITTACDPLLGWLGRLVVMRFHSLWPGSFKGNILSGTNDSDVVVLDQLRGPRMLKVSVGGHISCYKVANELTYKAISQELDLLSAAC